MKEYFSLALIIAVVIILLLIPSPLPARIGAIDFRPLWSASYLFARGENFSDAAALFQVERELTQWRETYPMLVWNPPWLYLFLAPLTLFSFSTAVWYWLLIGITLVGLSVTLVWPNSCTHDATRVRVGIGWIVAYTFSMTLIMLIAGQVDSLILLGLALFLFFIESERPELAGACLVLATVKPQLVYLTLPLLLLQLIYRRCYRAVRGFFTMLIGLIVAAFALRPTWPGEFVGAFGHGPVLDWEMPTIGGIIAATFGWSWARWISAIVLPLAVFIWFRWRQVWSWRDLVDLSLIFGIATAPYAWSYDQVLLLIPVLRVIVWGIEGMLNRATSIAIWAMLIAMNALSFYERILTPSELYFFWIPTVIAGIYLYAWVYVRVCSTRKNSFA